MLLTGPNSEERVKSTEPAEITKLFSVRLKCSARYGAKASLTYFLFSLANISCFCNSPSCPQAVCDSSQRCYSRLQKTASADANVSTSVMYGCLDEFNSSDLCLNSGVMMCCDTQLCNMPNKLRSKPFLNYCSMRSNWGRGLEKT